MASTNSGGQNATLPPLPSMSSNPVFAPKEALPSDSSALQTTASTSHDANANTTSARAAQFVSPGLSAYGIASRALSPVDIASQRDGIESRMGDAQTVNTDGGVASRVVLSQSHASAAVTDWEVAYETGQEEQWARKVREDLRGWRGGHGYVLSLLPGRLCQAPLAHSSVTDHSRESMLTRPASKDQSILAKPCHSNPTSTSPRRATSLCICQRRSYV